MICKNCGYTPLDVHRTSDGTLTYCQNCSQNRETPPDPNSRPVSDFMEARSKKQKEKLMNTLSPAARKRVRGSG